MSSLYFALCSRTLKIPKVAKIALYGEDALVGFRSIQESDLGFNVVIRDCYK